MFHRQKMFVILQMHYISKHQYLPLISDEKKHIRNRSIALCNMDPHVLSEGQRHGHYTRMFHHQFLCGRLRQPSQSHPNRRNRHHLLPNHIGQKRDHFQHRPVNNVISNVDSLVSWANVTRLVPTVYADGSVVYKYANDSIYYYFNSGKDSIDFTNPVEFVVLAYDGVNRKSYTVKGQLKRF